MSKKKITKLTARQEKFCQLYVAGASKADAYREAFSNENQNNATIQNNAYRLSVTTDVSARIEELQEELRLSNIYTLEKSVERDLKLIQRYEDALEVLSDPESEEKEISASERTIRHIGASGYSSAQERLSKQHGFFERDNKQKSNEVVIFEIPDNKR